MGTANRSVNFAVPLLLLAVASSCSYLCKMVHALSAAPLPKKNWVVVDFDGTCTVRDTIKMLPRLASLAQSKQQQAEFNSGSNEILTPDAAVDFQGRLSIFSILENEYFRRYTAVLETESEDDNIKESDDDWLEQLSKSIDRLDDVSTEITNEVSNWKVLGGLGGISNTEMIDLIELYREKQTELEPGKIGEQEVNCEDILECLALKKGCLSVLQKCAASDNFGVGVLSINWCPTLIESLLVHPMCATSAGGDNPVRFEDIPIWSNSVDQEGVVSLPFPGAISKKDQILKLQNGSENSESSHVVYIGDSSTDLLAILQADVGILLGGSKSAIGLAKKYGVSVKPLGDYYDTQNDDNNSHIWTAESWDDIGSFLDRFRE